MRYTVYSITWQLKFQNVLALKDTWNSLQLLVKDYAPEGTKRGLIFSGLEEVIQVLDDSSLSLQSMSGSRFAEPFVEEIRGLEKDITQAIEASEIWVQVQRKWLYLEGLFSGSDIHTRVPKEAEKFDKLNSIFKKVSSASKGICWNSLACQIVWHWSLEW